MHMDNTQHITIWNDAHSDRWVYQHCLS